MTKLYLLLLGSFLFFTSCRTANKAYHQGDYHNAIERAIKKLQKNPGDTEAKTVLKDAYRLAVAKHEDQVRILSGSLSESKFEDIYREYVQLQSLYRQLRDVPAVSTVLQPTDYASFVETYRDKAADVHIRKGTTYMEEGEKAAFRKAYASFKNALGYKPGDSEIRAKMVAAFERAVVHIVVLPIDEFGGDRYGYGNDYQLKNFENELVRNLKNNTNNEFVRFFVESEARRRDIQPDELLELRLGRMVIGRTQDGNQTHTSSKEVVVKETVYKPDSVVREYARITAQVTTTRRTLISTGALYVVARSPNGNQLWNDVFRGENRWQVEFATFRGDERALTDSDRALLNKRAERAPGEEELTENLLRHIENDLQSRIRQHYNRYY